MAGTASARGHDQLDGCPASVTAEGAAGLGKYQGTAGQHSYRLTSDNVTCCIRSGPTAGHQPANGPWPRGTDGSCGVEILSHTRVLALREPEHKMRRTPRSCLEQAVSGERLALMHAHRCSHACASVRTARQSCVPHSATYP